jgi:hypothetical protein
VRTSPSSLAVSSAGSAFPAQEFGFAVHSVFARAANLRRDDGFLLSLVSEAAKAHPRAALVPLARFDLWGLRPGDAGRFDGTTLSFASASAAAPDLVLPPSRTPPARERPRRPARPEALRAAAAAVAELRAERRAEPSLAALLAGDPPEGTGFSARFVRGALKLEKAAAALSVPLFLDAALSLAGFGPGLTPSGDDFLCGWFAGQRSRATLRPGLEAFLEACAAAALTEGALAGRTNDISAAFLAEAAAGRFGTALVAFACSPIGKKSEDIDG